jgi:RNA polymerase sigma-70 factor (ECF subfamily)
MSKRHILTHETPDDELFMHMQSSEEGAFEVIYERYHKLLYSLAYKYLKSKELSQDAVQHVFLKFWETRSVLTVQINLKNYLYTMLKNFVLNEIRDNIHMLEKSYEMAQFADEYEDELLEQLKETEMSEQLYKAINKLPEQKRRVCLYKLEGNVSNREIAKKMNISVPTVKTHYSQAIRILREYLEKLFSLFFAIVWF